MDSVNILLRQVLDATAMRNRAISNNIANADTPGYRRRDVSFLSELRTMVKDGDNESLRTWQPKMKTARREDPVRMEKEFASLAENQLLYEFSADILSRRYASIKKAISGKV